MNALALAATLAAALFAADAPPSPAPSKATGAKAKLTPGKPAAPPPAPVTARDPAADDRLLVEQKCAKCHDLARAVSTPLTEAGWHSHLKRIGSGGAATITEEQRRRIQAYLRSTGAAGKTAGAGASR